MTDFEYCIDRKPAITMLTTVLTTVYYGLLRFTTVLYPRYHTPHWPPMGPPQVARWSRTAKHGNVDYGFTTVLLRLKRHSILMSLPSLHPSHSSLPPFLPPSLPPPALQPFTTVLTTVYYGLLRFTTVTNTYCRFG